MSKETKESMKKDSEKKVKKPALPEEKEVAGEKILTAEEKKAAHIAGIKKTVVPAFLGTLFGLLFFLKFTDGKGYPWIFVLLLMTILTYYAQRFLIYPYMGLKVAEFEMKDWFYVEFMVLNFCLVTWILLLN